MPRAAGAAGADAGRGAAWHPDTKSRSRKARAPLSVLDNRRILAALTRAICIVGELFLTPQPETAIQILNQVGSGRRKVALFRWIVDLIPQVISPVPFREEKLEARAHDRGPVSYTHLRAHETPEHLVCRLLL